MTDYRCHNCGELLSSRPWNDTTPCPNPSPGTPLVDCGRGGHWFDVEVPERPVELVRAMRRRVRGF